VAGEASWDDLMAREDTTLAAEASWDDLVARMDTIVAGKMKLGELVARMDAIVAGEAGFEHCTIWRRKEARTWFSPLR